MSELGIDIQIACVKREIALRERVYPKWVASKKMQADVAELEITRMQAVLETLRKVQASGV